MTHSFTQMRISTINPNGENFTNGEIMPDG
jgi:hypothetical protein